MILPRVHLNGTDRTTLLDQNLEALEAVRGAIAALERAQPHSRDYYMLGDGAVQAAIFAHVSRLQELERISRDLQQLVDHLEK